MLPVALFFLTITSPLINSEIIINQVMIGQEGQAKNEFVELYNPGKEIIDLSKYKLIKKTKSGTTSNLVSAKKFVGLIPPQDYFLLSTPEFCPLISCDLSYSTSVSLASDNYLILEKKDDPTNNQEIKLDIKNNQVWHYNSKATEGNIVLHNLKNQKINITLDSPISEKTSNNLIISGVVSVLPKTLGSQYFYIHNLDKNEKGISGLQIYNYQKKFPDLKLGDYIKVSGILSTKEICPENISCPENSNFYRLKTKEISDIQIISHHNFIPLPEIEKISNLKWNQIGQLKTISGKITQNKTKEIYLDDGESEMLIEIKEGTQISSKSLSENFSFTLTGILNYNNTQLKLTLINPDYIIPLEEKKNETLGVLLTDSFWQIQKRNSQKKLLVYLAIILLATGVYLIYLKKKH